jgi:transposase
MDQERRHFTDAFKTEAIALLASSGRPLVQIAGELGLSPSMLGNSMLGNWRNRQGGQNAGSAVPPKPASAPLSVPDPAAEISRLRRENDRLRMEHIVSDITGATGMRLVRAIVAGERDPVALATHRDRRCHASAEEISAALAGNWREEHVFALGQALDLYDAYQAKLADCDARIEQVLGQLRTVSERPAGQLPPARHRDNTANAPAFNARAMLHSVLGIDLTQIPGLGPSLVLKLIGECGTDFSAWPDAKHFTSWLCLAPSNKISGGKLLSARTRRSGSRAAALLRLAATTVGRTQTALGAFYRRLSARIGKAKAVTATARKIAVLFYNAVRHGMDYSDPGTSYYEERYRARVLANLRRRAKNLGFVLQEASSPA